MITRSKTIIVAFFCLSLILTACTPAPQETPAQITPEEEDTFIPSQAGIWATGNVVLTSSYNLSFPFAGQLAELTVREGDLVAQGDVIARLDTSLVAQDISEAQASLKIAQADLALIRVDGTLEAILAAVARVEYAQTQLDAARLMFEKAELIAPKDGTVLEVYIQANEYAGTGARVVQVGDPDDLSIEVWMNETDVALISVGDTAQVSFEAIPNVSSEAVVTGIAPDPDRAEQRAFKITLKLQEKPEGLRWGMTGDVVFKK